MTETVSLPTTPRRPRSRHTPGGQPYLSVRDLAVSFPSADGSVHAVRGLTFDLHVGQTLAIVGESGSGKSVSSMAVMGLHDPAGARVSGSIMVDGREIVGVSADELRRHRGSTAAMIFQDPLSSLHPYFTIGNQIAEAYRSHNRVSMKTARKRAAEMLGRVGIPQPQRRLDDYPHQFSGGMRQRVMIAMALVNDPKLLIADEPTTALDVTVQAQILDLIVTLQEDFQTAVLFITHDLGVVAEVADQILVMYGGRAVEYGSTEAILGSPLHPYTWGLLESVPAVIGTPGRLHPIPGSPPSVLAMPTGCAFHPRCEFRGQVADDACTTALPRFDAPASGSTRRLRCHLMRPELIFEETIRPRLP